MKCSTVVSVVAAIFNARGSKPGMRIETGIYFHFFFQTQETTEDDGDEPREYFPVAFNVNYFRPSYFILEAESEIMAFVKHFDLLVSDPQCEGMGQGEYDAAKLVRGWNFGNECLRRHPE